MSNEVLLFLYCLLVVVASMAGGWLPSLVRMTHLRTQLLMSFVGGLMLGIAILHLLPHAIGVIGSVSQTCVAMLVGLVSMFLLMRMFHTHDHSSPMVADLPSVPAVRPGDGGSSDLEHQHGPHCNHSHSHSHGGSSIGWAGLIFGLGLHTIVDGIALAASVAAEKNHNVWLGLAGLGTFLAVALHKPLDAFAITSVMQKSGLSISGQTLANILFSLACPIGAVVFYFGVDRFDGGTEVLGWGLAVAAGFFLCIALADLLPEVAFHDHDRVKLTVALIAGVLLAVAIENLPGHSHQVGEAGKNSHEHLHDGHDHP